MAMSSRIPELHEIPPEEEDAVSALDSPTENEARNQGAWAYSFGRNVAANPYDRDTNRVPWAHWRTGWFDARAVCGG